ncbi:putative dentin sialophosphoprotein-like [Capsicum annuum]|nr:putative dentin sialophosphoprotein-like [Capsicum annuum]
MEKNAHRDEEVKRKYKTPKSHFVVYVGEELRRFVLHISYLKNPCFQKLLEEAAQEFGFQSPKGIVLPCDECTFQKVMHFISSRSSD